MSAAAAEEQDNKEHIVPAVVKHNVPPYKLFEIKFGATEFAATVAVRHRYALSKPARRTPHSVSLRYFIGFPISRAHKIGVFS